MLPLLIGCFWLLVQKAEHPISGKMYYFVDKCLPFGHCISCALFQKFSDALPHMIKFLLKEKRKIEYTPLTNYLDDFLFATLKRAICNIMIQEFLSMCATLGVPISIDKTEWASDLMVFLGILLDGKFKILAIPEEKQNKAVHALSAIIDSKKCTVKEIQSLAGLLNFLNKAIIHGRAFTRQMYAKFSNFVDYKGNKVYGSALKSHHHIRIDSEFRADCHMWLTFLSMNNQCGCSLCRPLLDLNTSLVANILDFYTDAAEGTSLGLGGVFRNKWVFAQ